LVGFVLVIVCGLTASPVRAVVEDCNDYQIDKEPQTPPGSKCGGLSLGQRKKLITVTIENTPVPETGSNEIIFAECGLSINPKDLHAGERRTLSFILSDCTLLVPELKREFMVNVADIVVGTILLNKCATPDCSEIEDPDKFIAFQKNGLPPNPNDDPPPKDPTLELFYDEQLVFNILGCDRTTSSERVLAVVGQLEDDAQAIADGSIVGVGGSFIRGIGTVVCGP
jgi:hypothetical protein